MTTRQAQLADCAQKLAVAFGERRLDRAASVDLVSENIAELSAAGIIGASSDGGPGLTLAESTGLLRIIAGGCGCTAFAMSATLTGERPQAARQAWGNYCDAAVFLGLTERAYQLAVQRTKERSAAAAPGPARLPGVQFAIARIRGSLATMTALLGQHASQQAGPESGADGSAASWIARYYIAAAAEQAVSGALEIAGAHDPGSGQRMRCIWQDLKTGPVLPFSSDRALELIGKAALGIDPGETPRWL